MRIPVVISLFLSLASSACSRAAEADPAAKALVQQPTAAAASESEGAQSKKPLSHYLATATRVKVHQLNINAAGGGEKLLTKTLSAKETKDYLGRLDLNQRADGPLVRCPPTETHAFEDAAGTALGSISFCGEHARFDAPDKSFGGIHASKP